MKRGLAALRQDASAWALRWPVLAAASADGARLARWPALGRALPWLALLVGLGIGWRPGERGATFASSLWTLLPMLLLGASGARFGAPAWLGYIAGDLLIHPHRHHGSLIETALEVYAPLGIGYLLLGILLVANPLTAILTARQLSKRVGPRLRDGARRGLYVSVIVLASCLTALVLTWCWAQALPTLLRPVETWQGGRPAGEAAFTVQGREGWLTLLAVVVTAATALARVQSALRPAATRSGAAGSHGTASALSRAPVWTRALLRTLLLTYLLSGLYASWWDAGLFALLVFGMTALRGWLEHRAKRWFLIVERVPLLVRLLVVIGLAYCVALLVIDPLWRKTDTFRPVLLVSLVSLLAGTVLMPARAARVERASGLRSPS